MNNIMFAVLLFSFACIALSKESRQEERMNSAETFKVLKNNITQMEGELHSIKRSLNAVYKGPNAVEDNKYAEEGNKQYAVGGGFSRVEGKQPAMEEKLAVMEGRGKQVEGLSSAKFLGRFDKVRTQDKAKTEEIMEGIEKEVMARNDGLRGKDRVRQVEGGQVVTVINVAKNSKESVTRRMLVRRVANAVCKCVCNVSRSMWNMGKVCYGKLRSLCCRNKNSTDQKAQQKDMEADAEHLDFCLY